MAKISAALVKELRERTGSGMMECKKALESTAGDLEAAIEHLRKTGQAKAEKKAHRVAAEGQIMIQHTDDGQCAALVEINCETDFVAKDDNFQQFAAQVTERVLTQRPVHIEALLAMTLPGGETVDEARKHLIAKIGENINVRRFSLMATETGLLNSYLHGNRIGVVVELQGGDAALAKDIAMHVAASRPLCITPDQVPAEVLDKEREIYRAQAEQEGKPAHIAEKMVEGRLRKYLKEVTLLGQPFIKDPDQSVEQLLKQAGATAVHFERMELGEGIEKKVDNFAEEVMAQAST